MNPNPKVPLLFFMPLTRLKGIRGIMPINCIVKVPSAGAQQGKCKGAWGAPAMCRCHLALKCNFEHVQNLTQPYRDEGGARGVQGGARRCKVVQGGAECPQGMSEICFVEETVSGYIIVFTGY